MTKYQELLDSCPSPEEAIIVKFKVHAGLISGVKAKFRLRRITDLAEIMVSPEDEDLKIGNWRLVSSGRRGKMSYHCSSVRFRGKSKLIPLHRVIARRMGLNLEGMEVDHVNQNPLDNRRENIRAVTKSDNMGNLKQTRSKYGFFGIYTDKGKWRARVWTGGRSGGDKKIGWFDTPEQAARAYDEECKRIGRLTRNFRD